MSRRYGGWPAYVPVAVRRRKAARAMEQRHKAGQPVAPVTIAGRAIATTFWGKAWCDNIEGYHDFENRLPRGRTYVRGGAVVDLQIVPGRIEAVVCGSELYDVGVTVTGMAKRRWRAVCADCAGGIDSVVELLQGRFSRAVMQRLCRQEGGLFPRPSEIRFSCSCPDYAGMCKHVAAALYGVGARLDQQPELLFRLRGVDETELVAEAGAGMKLATRLAASERVLRTDDAAALFGLDMADNEPGPKGDEGSAIAGKAGGRSRPAAKTAVPPTRNGGAAADRMPRPAAEKAAATRGAARCSVGASSKTVSTAKAGTRGARNEPRPENTADVSLAAKTPPAAKAPPAAGTATKAGSQGAAARKRRGVTAPNAAGGKQKPVRWW